MTTSSKNVAASVRARLLMLSRERSEDFQFVLSRYVNERLLYRVSQSEQSSSFVLKGATLFALWTGHPHRATRDIDFLGLGEPSHEHLRDVFAEILSLQVDNDGVDFDLNTLVAGPIRDDKEYRGVRVKVHAYVSGARVRVQVDIGFGDVITPEARMETFPTLLSLPAPCIRAYPRETVVAEKLEAMVTLGSANSRMKDFYDLQYLPRAFSFDGALLTKAFRATFTRRGTAFPSGLPTALTREFTEEPTKQTQWRAFIRKTGCQTSLQLAEAAGTIANFVAAPLNAAARGLTFEKRWETGGPWR